MREKRSDQSHVRVSSVMKVGMMRNKFNFQNLIHLVIKYYTVIQGQLKMNEWGPNSMDISKLKEVLPSLLCSSFVTHCWRTWFVRHCLYNFLLFIYPIANFLLLQRRKVKLIEWYKRDHKAFSQADIMREMSTLD